MINTRKIKMRMLEEDLNQSDVSKAMNLAQSTLSEKINNKRPMKIFEAEQIAEILKLKQEEYVEYFFADPVA